MVECITADALKRRIERGESLVLLDVRQPEERAYCRIAAPGSVQNLHIPLGDIPRRLEELRSADPGPVVIYCHHGVRSLQAAHWLEAHGLSGLVNLEGGIDAWSVEADPTVPRY